MIGFRDPDFQLPCPNRLKAQVLILSIQEVHPVHGKGPQKQRIRHYPTKRDNKAQLTWIWFVHGPRWHSSRMYQKTCDTHPVSIFSGFRSV